MEYKILEANGIENENIDGAAFNNISVGSMSGILKGILNECTVYCPSSNILEISSGELIIHGFRVKLLTPYSITLTPDYVNTQYIIIARISVSVDRSVTFQIECISERALVKDNLYAQEFGLYEIEIVRFQNNIDGIHSVERTVSVIDNNHKSNAILALNNSQEALSKSTQALLKAQSVEQTSNHNSKRLENLEARLSDDVFITDSEVTAEKIVPANVAPYSEIVAVGGMTYRDEETNTLKNAKVKALKSKSKNLYDGEQNIVLSSTEVEEIIFEKPISETVTLSWKYSGNAESPDAAMFCIVTSDGTEKYVGLRAVFVTYDDISKIILLNWSKLNGTLYDIQLEYGDTITEFSPFSTLDTFTIPEAVQALEGYGLGLEGYPNTVEYANGRVKFEKQVKKGVVSNIVCVSWANYSNVDFYAFNMPSDYLGYKTDAFMLEGFNKKPSHSNWDSADYIGVATGLSTEYEIWVGFPKGTTQTEAEAALLGKSFVYALATPEVIDITDIMPSDNYTKVEGGGTIIADNEYGFAAPTTIKYQKRG